MRPSRANASLVAVLVILLVIAGVIYLFWQTSFVQVQDKTLQTSTLEETTNENTTTADGERTTLDSEAPTLLEGETTVSIEAE